MTFFEPIAITGIGCLYPGAEDKERFWRRLLDGSPRFSRFPASRRPRMRAAAQARLSALEGAFFNDEDAPDVQRFRIPPAYRTAVSRMTTTLLQAAADCVRDAGHDERSLPRDEVDVICGVCFGFDSTLANALKIEGVRLAHRASAAAPDPAALFEAARDRLRDHFGCTSHDRVGEMASSIAARIAGLFSLRGRLQAIENADATGFAALETACLALAAGRCRAALVATGQRMENALMPLALVEKGWRIDLDAGGAAQGETRSTPLGEGATALLLERLTDARRDGRPAYAVIRGLGASSAQAPGGFRYAGDSEAKGAALREACAQAGVAPEALDYLDGVLPPVDAEWEAASRAWTGADGRRRGASVATLGHSFANAALAAVAAASLALRCEVTPPLPGGRAEPWPRPADHPRHAGVGGVSVTGLNWHIVLSDAGPENAGREEDAATPPRRAARSGTNGATHPDDDPIAIVGMGGAFGPWRGRDAFGRALLESGDAVTPLSEAALPRGPFYDGDAPRALTSYAEFGAELGERTFDLSGHRIFPTRAATLDIAQKLALHVAAEALADYGVENRRDRIGRTAVIVASNLSLERERLLARSLHAAELDIALADVLSPAGAEAEPCETISHLTLDGCLPSGAAALISQCFDLRAATSAVEAACASTLAALYNAVLGLRLRRYDLAVAGGVELPANARDMTLCAAQLMLSRDRIAPFCEGADGFSPGDGAAMFVLKRLSDARRDGDVVFAAITGAGASSDAGSMTAPDPDGQELAMRRAFAQAGYPPATVHYVEAHGTGTRLGDLAEITSLARVYGGPGRTEPLRIGSVKSNIGHAFAAAGGAGLLKTLLALRGGAIPPTILRRGLNPDLPLADIPAVIADRAEPWPSGATPRRAAVNAMGTGGVNYHLLLEAQDAAPPPFATQPG